eukprot:9828341-Heterocapsa_arctica.AAC.1
MVDLVWPPVDAGGRIAGRQDGPRDPVKVGFGPVWEVTCAAYHVCAQHAGAGSACIRGGAP